VSISSTKILTSDGSEEACEAVKEALDALADKFSHADFCDDGELNWNIRCLPPPSRQTETSTGYPVRAGTSADRGVNMSICIGNHSALQG